MKYSRSTTIIYLLFFSAVVIQPAIATAQGTQAALPAGAAITITTADSLSGMEEWAKAKPLYEEMSKTITNDPTLYNKLGYCLHNLGNYKAAIQQYEKAIGLNFPPRNRWIVYSRMARSYSRLKEVDKSFTFLDSAFNNGYANVHELNTLEDFTAMRKDARFKNVYDKLYVAAYPCAKDDKSREFDFWVGEWKVYPTGGFRQTGHSKIEKTTGECTIIENWTSINGPGAYSGKSFNFFNNETGHWEQYWRDSGGAWSFSGEGTYTDGAMRFKRKDKDAKGEFIANFIFYNMEAGKMRQFLEKSYDGGKTWQTTIDLTYIRVK